MNTIAPQAQRPRKRRWFQYSLRSLLVLMLLASIGMSCVAVRVRKSMRQRNAAEGIMKLGGSVTYDYEIDSSGKPVPNGAPNAPAWTRRLLGDDLFADVIAADVRNDAGMELLGGLPHLRELTASNDVTNAGLAHLRGLRELRSLSLAFTNVTDAGMEYLRELTQLQSLDLAHSKVTDDGVAHLQSLRELESVNLSWTKVTGAGLAILKELPKLRYLDLYETPEVSEKDVADFQRALPKCWIFRGEPDPGPPER